MTRDERFAYVCTNKNCVPPVRIFAWSGEEKPRCPEHGATMRRQANMPYTSSSGTKPRLVLPPRPKAK